MDARECYVLREEFCRKCNGAGYTVRDLGSDSSSAEFCRCYGGKVQYRVPLIDALRALGIDVPEPEDAPPAMCPP